MLLRSIGRRLSQSGDRQSDGRGFFLAAAKRFFQFLVRLVQGVTGGLVVNFCELRNQARPTVDELFVRGFDVCHPIADKPAHAAHGCGRDCVESELHREAFPELQSRGRHAARNMMHLLNILRCNALAAH